MASTTDSAREVHLAASEGIDVGPVGVTARYGVVIIPATGQCLQTRQINVTSHTTGLDRGVCIVIARITRRHWEENVSTVTS